jgi:D-tyrosyl-tRNA(Tyr) deacylase
MITVIQRVTQASVDIDHQRVAEIQTGLLALIGIEKQDSIEQGKKLIKKILAYRIFPDTQQKMNLDLTQISGGLLLVPQFTLVAETDKGTRPGFSKGMSPIQGQTLFNEFVEHAKTIYPHVSSGCFGADMKVHLINDGPVTFILKA